MRLFSSSPSEPGVFAVGQFATGIFVLGQFGRGIFVVGQFAIGVFAIGQFAVGLLWALGQFAVGGRTLGFMLDLGLLPRLRWPWEDPALPESLPGAELLSGRHERAWGRARLQKSDSGVFFESAGQTLPVELTNAGLVNEVEQSLREGVKEGLFWVERVEDRATGDVSSYREAAPQKKILVSSRFQPIKRIWRGLFWHPNKDEQPLSLVGTLWRLFLYVPVCYGVLRFVFLPLLGEEP